MRRLSTLVAGLRYSSTSYASRFASGDILREPRRGTRAGLRRPRGSLGSENRIALPDSPGESGNTRVAERGAYDSCRSLFFLATSFCLESRSLLENRTTTGFLVVRQTWGLFLRGPSHSWTICMERIGYGYTEYEIEEKIRVYPDDEYRVRHRRWR